MPQGPSSSPTPRCHDMTASASFKSMRIDAKGSASPTGYDFDSFDTDRVGSTAFEQSARCANILTCLRQQPAAFVAIRKLSREGHVQLSRLCENCQGRSRPDNLDYAFAAFWVFGY